MGELTKSTDYSIRKHILVIFGIIGGAGALMVVLSLMNASHLRSVLIQGVLGAYLSSSITFWFILPIARFFLIYQRKRPLTESEDKFYKGMSHYIVLFVPAWIVIASGLSGFDATYAISIWAIECAAVFLVSGCVGVVSMIFLFSVFSIIVGILNYFESIYKKFSKSKNQIIQPLLEVNV